MEGLHNQPQNYNKIMNKLNLLSRAEMRKVMGGAAAMVGTCAWHDGNAAICGLSKEQAQTYQEHAGGKWCCDSCPASLECVGDSTIS